MVNESNDAAASAREAGDSPPEERPERSSRAGRVRAADVGLAVSATLVALVLVGLAGEAAARYRERTRDTVPGSIPGLMYRHERLRHALTRDFEYYSWLTVDPNGFRGPAVPFEKPDSTFRIMVVGASTVFDLAVTADQRAWPARLAVFLNERVDDVEVEVINGGVPGYVLLDNLMRLQTELHRYDPDLIVFYQAHNDLIAALHQVHEVERGRRQPYRIEPLSPWSDWLTRHSILYPKLLTRGRVWQQRAMLAERRSVNRPEIYTQSIERGVARHERDLRSFLAVAQTFEIPTVIPEVTFAGAGFEIELGSSLDRLWEGAVGLPTEHIMSGYRQYEAVTERVAAEFDVPYFQTVSAGTGAADSYAPDDPIHFNDVGAERMAEVVGRWLFGADLIR